MSTPSNPTGASVSSADVLKTTARWLLAAVIVAAIWAFSSTPEAGESGWSIFADRAVQLSMLALTLGAQRVSLLYGILAGVILGFVAVALYDAQMASFALIGKFFLTSLKMIIVPLIAFAVISAMTSLGDVRRIGRLGSRTVLYYFLTTTIAVVVGAVLVNIIEPGAGMAIGNKIPDNVAAKTDMGLAEIVLGFIHNNIVGAFATMKMLPIIVFCVIFGAVLTTIGKQGETLIAFCEGGNAAMMKIVEVVLLLAPVGVFGLLAGSFGTALAEGHFWEQLAAVRDYSLTVVLGLGIHAVVVLPIILKFTTGRSPIAYARGMATALMTAFSTASSAATIPLTLDAVENANGVDPKAAQFVVPLGATVNMDGTALYEAVAVIFIAQAAGIDLTISQQILVVITATLAAIGAAGIPQAGLVTMVIVLQAVDLPLEGVELILAVDPLLDRFRTAVNVWGDGLGAAVVEPYALELRETDSTDASATG